MPRDVLRPVDQKGFDQRGGWAPLELSPQVLPNEGGAARNQGGSGAGSSQIEVGIVSGCSKRLIGVKRATE